MMRPPGFDPSPESGQSVVEYALILLLIAIVILAILLILGDDLRAFVFDLLRTWFPERFSHLAFPTGWA